MDQQIEMIHEDDIVILANKDSNLQISIHKADKGFDIGFLDTDNNESIIEVYYGNAFWNGKRISIQPK